MVTKYDVLLALLPSGLLGGGVLTTLGIEPMQSMFGGGLFSLFVLIYALFIDPPKDPMLGPHH